MMSGAYTLTYFKYADCNSHAETQTCRLGKEGFLLTFGTRSIVNILSTLCRRLLQSAGRSVELMGPLYQQQDYTNAAVESTTSAPTGEVSPELFKYPQS
jgi:hypothetical protein